MDYREKMKVEKGTAIVIALVMTLVGFFFATLLESDSDAPLANVIRLNTSTNREVQISGRYVFYLEAGSLHCVNAEGSYVWNLGVDSDSHFSVTDHGVAVWNRKKITVVERETGHVLATKNMQSDILTACVGEIYVAAVLGPENESDIALMTLSGVMVDTIDSFHGYTVLDCGFFEGRELFWMMTLDSSGSVPTCRISTFIPGKRETGSIMDYEQVIYQVMFRSSYIEAVGTNYMRLFDYTGSEKKDGRVTVYGWYLESVDKRSDDPLMLFVPDRQVEGDRAIQDVRMMYGGEEKIIHLPIVCKQLEAFGTNLYGFSQTHLAIHAYGSNQTTVLKFPVAVDTVIGITSDNTAVVTSGGAIFMVRLP